MHVAVAVYAVEFVLFVMIISIIVMSCIALSSANKTADIIDALVSENTVTTVVDGGAEADAAANQTDAKKPVNVGSANRVGIAFMIIFGCVLLTVAIAFFGILNYAMADCYLSSYKCKPYDMRGLAESLARGGVGKVAVVNIIRASLGFLLLLCFIVPGVIYLIRTSMANYLLLANPKMKATTALSASNKVMSGKTGGYFTLEMSFFAWWLLGIATLGAGFVFIKPYMNLTKTVYYKRNLQGDKTVYKQQPVPQTPSPTPPPAPSRPVDNVAPDQQVFRPISNEHINLQGMPMQNVHTTPMQPSANEAEEPAVTPIDTLDADDVRAMNDAMRDVGNHEPADIPEIPIKPVTAPKKPVAEQVVGTPVEDSDLVEIVKPVRTNELPEDNEFERDMERLFGSEQKASQHNYFPRNGDGPNQSPNDFVTMESQAVDMNTDKAASDSASDEKFDDFMKRFEETTVGNTSSSGSERENGSTFGNDSQPLTTRNRPTPFGGESRTDRIRREREERLRNLKND